MLNVNGLFSIHGTTAPFVCHHLAQAYSGGLLELFALLFARL